MFKAKAKKFITSMFAVALSICVLGTTGINILSVPVYAADSDQVKVDRNTEGKNDVSEDIDFTNDINIDHSFAYQVRMATNYANRMDSNGVPLGGFSGDGVQPYSNNINMSNIGVFFGYTDGEIITDTTNSDQGLRGSRDSNSNILYSRDKFLAAGKTESTYADYGLMLYLMGFDSVGTSAPDAERATMGAIASASYYAASSVNMLFDLMFKVLESTNPFQFFKDIALQSTAGSTELENIATDASDSELMHDSSGVLASLGVFFTNIFNMMLNISWTIMIPLSLVFIIVAYFLTRNGRYTIGRNLKKFVIRCLFLVIGIPILGSAYTQCLDALKESNAMSDEFITESVSYTFLDFGAWVEQRRLGPVEGNDFYLFNRGDDGSRVDAFIPAKSWLTIRSYCNNLNKENKVISNNDSFLTINSKTGALLKDYLYETSGAKLSTDATDHGKTNYNNRQSISTLISKFMNGEKYTASTFEDGVMASLATKNINYGDMLVLSCSKYSFSQGSERAVVGIKDKTNEYYNDGTTDAITYAEVASQRFSTGGFSDHDDWRNINLYNNGSLQAPNWTAAGKISLTGIPTLGVYFDNKFSGGSGDSGSGVNGLDPSKKTGFSTMSMYTYLTSSFSQTGVTAYGPAPSVYTQNNHYAVNLIGGNYIMRFAFFANMIAILLGYFILAVFFVFRTAFEILFKGFQVMAHALLAAVGFYKSIATVICMTVNMIAQLFVSVVFFSFMVDLMFIMTSIFNEGLAVLFFGSSSTTGLLDIASLSGATGNNHSFMGEVVVITSSLLSTLVIVFFISFAIRWRASLMNAINGMVEQLVGTLLGVSAAGASNGGMSGMAAGALNDTANIAKIGAGVGAGLGVVSMGQDMVSDLAQSAGEQFGDHDADDVTKDVNGNKDAVDAAVNPSTGVDFDGGLGKAEGDAEASRDDVADVLENGLDGKPAADTGVDDMAIAGSTINESGHGGGGRHRDSETTAQDGYTTDAEQKAKEAEALKEQEANKAANDDNADADANNLSTTGIYGNVAGSTGEAGDKDVLDRTNDVSSAVSETEDGTLWSQTNAAKDTTTGIRLDPERGLVLGMVGAGDKTSDIALGTDGISIGTVGANGEEQVVTAGAGGITTSYTDENGVKETSEISLDGMNSGVTTTRELADGSVETTQATLDGITKSRKEVAADGSTRITTTDDTGMQTIEETNATTGYTSLTQIASDGTSTQTENVNGVETVSSRDADGNITSQMVTKTGADGTVSSTGYRIDENGTTIETVSANGITTEVATTLDGDRTETQSVVQDNGNVVKTTTAYGNDATADSVHTEVTSANGMQVLQTSDTSKVTDDTGTYTQTVTSSNGAELVTKSYDDGRSVSIETANGVETVTSVSAAGKKVVTETDAETGNVSTTTFNPKGGYETVVTNAANEEISVAKINGSGDGTITEATAGGGRTETNISGDTQTVKTYDVSGNMTEKAVTTMHDNGSSETVYSDASNNAVGKVVRTASGEVTVENDGNSNIVPTVTQSVNDAGKTVYTETSASGMTVQTVANGDGNVTMTTTSAAGTVNAVTMQDGNVVSESMTNALGGQNVTTVDGNTGKQATAYVNASGGSMSTYSVGSGSDAQTIDAQAFATGDKIVSVTNDKTQDVSVTRSDSFGNQTVAATDASSGTVFTQFTTAGGSTGQEVTETNGSYTRTVNLAGGGTETVVRSGSGNDMTETSVRTNAMGDTQRVVTQGGQVQSVEVTSGNAVTFTQTRGDNGEVITNQTLESGSTVSKTVQSNGDYRQQTINPNGSSCIIESNDGVVTRKDVSVTGVVTSSVLSGDMLSETSQLSGSTFTTATNVKTGQSTRSFQTFGGQNISFGDDGNGNQSVAFETGNGDRASYRTTQEGVTSAYRNASGSSFTEYTPVGGTAQSIFTDVRGNVVSAPAGADTVNQTFAQQFAQSAATVQRGAANIQSNLFGVSDGVSTFNTGSLNFNTTDVQGVAGLAAASGVFNVIGNMTTPQVTPTVDLSSLQQSTGTVFVNANTPGSVAPGTYTPSGVYNGTNGYVDAMYTGVQSAPAAPAQTTQRPAGRSFSERLYANLFNVSAPSAAPNVAAPDIVTTDASTITRGRTLDDTSVSGGVSRKTKGTMSESPTEHGGSTTNAKTKE